MIISIFQFLRQWFQKFKDQDIWNYNFADCFLWVWNVVVDIAEGKEAEGV